MVKTYIPAPDFSTAPLPKGYGFEPHKEGDNYDKDDFSLFLMVDRILKEPSVQRGIEFGYLSVTKACLDFDGLVEALYHPDLRERPNIRLAEAKCRAVVLMHLLKPLISELERTYPQAAKDLSDASQHLMAVLAASLEPDEKAEVRSIARKLSGHEKLSVKQNINTSHEAFHSIRKQLTPLPLRTPILAVPIDTPMAQPFVLFEDNSVMVPPGDYRIARCQVYADLFKEFLRSRMKQNNGRTRVKIAVLDTGIDEEDDVFAYQRRTLREQRSRAGDDLSDPIKSSENFIGGNDVDSNGHGTHVATLLMEYAPQADLYVAKIAHTPSVADVSHISTAIDWAIKQEVDIITMSFGLSEISIDPDTLVSIQQAIGMASLRNILLFAAASNCAGNGPRAYPALDPRVICAHAVDGKGNDDGGLNPPEGHYRDRFATLGVAIEFSWFGKSSIRSGTSYATPMLAAIAANVLDYTSHAVTEGMLPRRTFDKLRTQAGMEKLFHMMSTRINHTHDYVAPWWLWTQQATDESVCSRLKTEL